MAKKIINAKEPVRLRTKKLANGSLSLYFDIYRNGKRTYEYLKMYLIPERTEEDKKQNQVTLNAANKLKSERIIAMTNGEAGIKTSEETPKILLLDWMQKFKEGQERRGRKASQQVSCVMRLLKMYSPNTTLDQVDKHFCHGYIEFLVNDYRPKGKELKRSTQHSYYRTLNGALNAAVREDLITINPFTRLSSSEKLQQPEGQREYMTMDEVRALIATPMKHPNAKAAYLFSCFCGLRMSDIIGLRWKDVFQDGEQTRLQVIMQKTKAPIYLPLSKEALRWMPERGEKTAEEHVFDLPSPTIINKVIKPWAKDAGITKLFTFHTARHTFATMMLTLGADLYTTSKLLGHADVRMTQIYAKIVNKKKDEAVNLVNGLFD